MKPLIIITAALALAGCTIGGTMQMRPIANDDTGPSMGARQSAPSSPVGSGFIDRAGQVNSTYDTPLSVR